MKRLVLALTLVPLLLTGSQAGPNEGGILAVHGNVDGIETDGDPCTAILLPDACSELVPTATPDSSNVEWFLILAAREPEPLSISTIVFGVGDYDPYVCYIAQYGPCHQELGPLEIPSAGWPGPYSGTSPSWYPNCLDGTLIPIYYFGINVYGPGQIPLGNYYPGGSAAFANCTAPILEDPIADFGTIGCGGAEGENPCPTTSVPEEPDFGEMFDESTTWGRIKSTYR